MALGFIRKVFSFGTREVIEGPVDETAPLAPINWDALETLRRDDAGEPPAEPPAEARGAAAGPGGPA